MTAMSHRNCLSWKFPQLTHILQIEVNWIRLGGSKMVVGHDVHLVFAILVDG